MNTLFSDLLACCK